MIIIAGDSWGCGEWQSNKGNIHSGLEYYFSKDGHTVLNLSVGGANNLTILYNLESALGKIAAKKKLNEIKGIFIFQTEWTRDFKILPNVHIHSFVDAPQLSWYTIKNFNSKFITTWLSRWQYRLSELAQTYSVRIGLIGGCSDTVYLDNFEVEYPGLYIACQSFTNLIINNNHRIDIPVFSASGLPPSITNKSELAVIDINLEYLTNQIDLAISRRNLWKNNQLEFPDQTHPGRKEHFKLYQWLKETYDIQSHQTTQN